VTRVVIRMVTRVMTRIAIRTVTRVMTTLFGSD
jgi:hypothetical protein